MKLVTALLICLLPFAKSFAQYKSQLNTRSSVVFPSKPKEMQQEGQQILVSTLDKDNKVTAMATAIDVSQFGVDSAALAANYNNSMFIELILQSVIGQYSGMKVIEKKKVAVGKLMGYDVSLKNDNPTADVPYRNIYAHVMFAGSNVFALTVLDESQADTNAYKDKFFSSLKVD